MTFAIVFGPPCGTDGRQRARNRARCGPCRTGRCPSQLLESHMPEQNRPASIEPAPDTATVYDRAKPERDAGMGRLDNNDDATPIKRPDCIEQAVRNKQHPANQVNAEDIVNAREGRKLNERE